MEAELVDMKEEYRELVAEYKDLREAQRRGDNVRKALEEVAQAVREKSAALDKMRTMFLGVAGPGPSSAAAGGAGPGPGSVTAGVTNNQMKAAVEAAKDELGAEIRKLEMKLKPARPATTASYEQLLANHRSVQKSISTFVPKLSSIPEENPPPDFVNKSTPENSAMLPRVLAALQNLTGAHGSRYKVHDTHNNRFLSDLAPDITLTVSGHPLSAFNAVMVIELQRDDLDNKHRGKALRCCKAMLEANPARPFAICLLTNTEVLEVFEVRRTMDEDYIQSNSVNMANGGWSCIRHLVLERDAKALGMELPIMEFGDSGGSLVAVELLGTGRGTQVYKVHHNGSDMVCKVFDESRAFAFDSELGALKAIIKAQPSSALPHLVDSNRERRLLLTTPVLKAHGYLSHSNLEDLVGGLVHLHTAVKFVHRDIEPKHVGVHGPDGRLGIMDCGSAVPIQVPAAESVDVDPATSAGAAHAMQAGMAPARSAYSGTLFMASDDVLDALAEGRVPAPHVSCDFVALVKSVYVMIHGSAEYALSSQRQKVDEVLNRAQPGALLRAAVLVRAFWEDELSMQTTAGAGWRALVDAAHSLPDPSTGDAARVQYQQAVESLRERLAAMLRGRP